MATTPPLPNGVIVEAAAAVAFVAFAALILAAGAAIAGELTFHGIASPQATLTFFITTVICLIGAGMFGLAAVFA